MAFDPPATDRLAELRARQTLAEAGLDIDVPLERASSVTNEVWLTPEHVVRVNRRADGRLRREAEIVGGLGVAVGYPEIIAVARDDSSDWMVSKRIPGVVLSRVWPKLPDEQRAEIVLQLAGLLEKLHEAPFRQPRLGLPTTPQLVRFDIDDPVAPLRTALTDIYRAEYIPKDLAMDVASLVERAAPSFLNAPALTSIHGDLTFENILYDNGNITAILDFEWARNAPPDLELDILLRFACYPKLHVAADYESRTNTADYLAIPRLLEAGYPSLFQTPQLFDRLLVYSIGFDARELLMFPPTGPIDRLPAGHPIQRMRRTVEGTSHLHQITARA